MGKAILWVLDGDPKDVKIVDKNGKDRHPNLDKVRKNKTIKGGQIAGRYGRGVGVYLYYGEKLGSKAELTAKGNKYTTNDEILEAIGYKKTIVELD